MQGQAILKGGFWDGVILPRRGAAELQARLSVERPDSDERPRPGLEYVRTDEWENGFRVYRFTP